MWEQDDSRFLFRSNCTWYDRGLAGIDLNLFLFETDSTTNWTSREDRVSDDDRDDDDERIHIGCVRYHEMCLFLYLCLWSLCLSNRRSSLHAIRVAHIYIYIYIILSYINRYRNIIRFRGNHTACFRCIRKITCSILSLLIIVISATCFSVRFMLSLCSYLSVSLIISLSWFVSVCLFTECQLFISGRKNNL